MSIGRADFVQEILADPENDDIRLVCADWFEEQGDSPRAEFIRTQIERARLPETDPRQSALEARELRLLHEHGPRWCGSHKVFKKSRFRRGFIECVHIHLQHWLHHRRQMYALEPVRDVRLTGFYRAHDDLIQRVARTEEWKHIESLILHHQDPPQTNAIFLLESPHLTKLKALRMRAASFDTETRSRFERLPLLKQLEELWLPFLRPYRERLPGDWLSDGSEPAREWVRLKALRLPEWDRTLVPSLSRMPWWNQVTRLQAPLRIDPYVFRLPTGLEYLKLEGANQPPPNEPAVNDLVKALVTRPLRELTLSCVPLTVDQYEQLFAAGSLPLDRLHLSNGYALRNGTVSLRVAEVLADAPRLRELKHLGFMADHERDDAMEMALFGGANFDSLASLDYYGGRVTRAVLEMLARKLSPGMLRDLQLYRLAAPLATFLKSPAAQGLVWFTPCNEESPPFRIDVEDVKSMTRLPHLRCLNRCPPDLMPYLSGSGVVWVKVEETSAMSIEEYRAERSPSRSPPLDQAHRRAW